jgi:hypothetical protein
LLARPALSASGFDRFVAPLPPFRSTVEAVSTARFAGAQADSGRKLTDQQNFLSAAKICVRT